jgi:urease accessory protein
MAPWLLLQLADGSFPSGAFAHSSGLEAATVLGAVDASPEGLARFLDASLRQSGHAQLPFVRLAAERIEELEAADVALDAMLSLRGPNLASRAQGRALANAAAETWDVTAPVAAHARRAPAHHAVVFGAVFGLLGVSVEETLAAYLHGAARGILSAAVRLGLVGPLEAQRILASLSPLLERILRERPAVDDAAMTAPLLEIYGALHDRLDGRMFQS